jgi:hypothetical protein
MAGLGHPEPMRIARDGIGSMSNAKCSDPFARRLTPAPPATCITELNARCRSQPTGEAIV